MRRVPDDALLAIQRRFNEVILSRAADLIDTHGLALPELSSLLSSGEQKAWFPVPGMYGGFSYWLEGDGRDTTLLRESWFRVVEGSGRATSSGRPQRAALPSLRSARINANVRWTRE